MIQIEENAVTQLKLLQQQLKQESIGLRLIAKGDPCTGIKIQMGWTAIQQPDDVLFRQSGLTFLADRREWPLLKDCHITLAERQGQPGFNIQPQPANCSCSSGSCSPSQQAAGCSTTATVN